MHTRNLLTRVALQLDRECNGPYKTEPSLVRGLELLLHKWLSNEGVS